jgi:hypothetical protein
LPMLRRGTMTGLFLALKAPWERVSASGLGVAVREMRASGRWRVGFGGPCLYRPMPKPGSLARTPDEQQRPRIVRNSIDEVAKQEVIDRPDEWEVCYTGE